MSYSFQVRAATKALVISAVAAKLDEVVAQQPAHAEDAPVHLAAASAIVELLRVDDESDVSVTMSGSVSTMLDGTGASSAGVNISAYLPGRVAE